jgi:hypothetical protein
MTSLKPPQRFPWPVAWGALALALAVTLASLAYQRPSDAFCGGRLSAGFPAPLVCDASGESPLSSVGRIDRADANSVNLVGALVDLLLYAVAAGALASAVSGLQKRLRPGA